MHRMSLRVQIAEPLIEFVIDFVGLKLSPQGYIMPAADVVHRVRNWHRENVENYATMPLLVGGLWLDLTHWLMSLPQPNRVTCVGVAAETGLVKIEYVPDQDAYSREDL